MRRTVAVIGGGFGGLRVAQRLARHRDRDALDVVLIDQSPYHFLRPKLPQALGARIACAVHVPLAELLASSAVRLVTAQVTAIDSAARRVRWTDGALDADVLVLALGGESSVPQGLADDPGALLPVWGFEQTCGIRRRIGFLADAARRGRAVDTDVAIIGGGFVGVEVAAEVQGRLARMSRDGHRATVTLVEAQARVLPRLGAWAGHAAARRLAASGVQVLLRTRAVRVRTGGVEFADGRRLAAGTVIWAGGRIQAPGLAAASGLADETGRIPVTDTLAVAEHADIFALGDCAYSVGREAAASEPSAHRAEAQAAVVARNVLARFRHHPLVPYQPGPNIYAVGLGPRYGILEAGRLRAAGLGPALLKELIILRHLAEAGGWRVLRGAAPRVVLDELHPARWDGEPLPDGVVSAGQASRRAGE